MQGNDKLKLVSIGHSALNILVVLSGSDVCFFKPMGTNHKLFLIIYLSSLQIQLYDLVIFLIFEILFSTFIEKKWIVG